MSTILDSITKSKIFKNSKRSSLIEASLKNNEAHLGPNGELVVLTGSHTGRSANDKYVVFNKLTEEKIWWENNIHKMTDANFARLKEDVLSYFNSQKELFFTERSIGSVSKLSVGIDFLSTQASAALFTQYMFKELVSNKVHDTFSVLHAPYFKYDPKSYDARSETIIVTCFKEKITIIVGTLYAGEIKKSMFSTMNYLLPDHGVLPMHSGANQNSMGESFVFFGLSGTGKTTLSTDTGLQLIGDDEHGLSHDGIFNLEGGCYAKTSKLSKDTEPEIYLASTQFASFLENVKLSQDQSIIDFFDESITENGRSSYPLNFISNRVLSAEGTIPKNIFYLSADAFGVLPPVSLLTAEQAMDYFLLGYSAKLAGTEIGVKAPVATFSSFFGAPFMMRKPNIYSSLLQEFITKYNIKVWLINTGWHGGSYGAGERFKLSTTRSIIRAIQNNQLANVSFAQDEVFHLSIPTSINGVDNSLLIPSKSWENKSDYLKTATKLKESFETELSKFKNNN